MREHRRARAHRVMAEAYTVNDRIKISLYSTSRAALSSIFATPGIETVRAGYRSGRIADWSVAPVARNRSLWKLR